MSYLIVKVYPLGDQYECDADREPYKVVEDWRKERVTELYEVYQINEDGSLTLVKKYDTALESGMALYFFNEEDDWEEVEPTIIYKFPDMTRHDKVPKNVKQYVKNFEQVDANGNLSACGSLSYDNDGKHYIYGEYADGVYTIGY